MINENTYSNCPNSEYQKQLKRDGLKKVETENRQLREALTEVRADLFYQIESKHGAKAASQYPCIIKADELLNSGKEKTTVKK